MVVSRRRLVQGTVAAGVTAAVTSRPVAASELQQTSIPEPSVIALNRMAFGPRPGDVARVRTMGLPAYITEQLNPPAGDDPACLEQLQRIRVLVGTELRPILGEGGNLLKTTKELWALRDSMEFGMRIRPWQDVRVAAFIRGMYSKYQLREVMADFWHNHFNVRPSSDTTIAVGMPEYDEIIRTNWNGNFRQFVEAIGKSVAMLYDLDNVSNRAGGAEAGNENYARELFELQTLGSDNYLQFAAQSEVPTIKYGTETFAAGYLDKDVYEAAECFTGWTVANGHWERQTLNDGSFYYDTNWHSGGLKRVLKKDIDNGVNNPLKDGRDVYDLLCNHPGTARTICTKLCRRLIADNPPASIIDAAVAKWMATRTAPDQIKQVLAVILSSNEFKNTWGQKMKRPFEMLVSYFRALEAVPPLDELGKGRWNGFLWSFALTGHRFLDWPTPTGHPDVLAYWSNTNCLLQVWNQLTTAANFESWGDGFAVDIMSQTNMSQTCTQIVDAWIGRMFGRTINATTRQQAITFLAAGGDANKPPAPRKYEDAQAMTDRGTMMVRLLAMSPDFFQR